MYTHAANINGTNDAFLESYENSTHSSKSSERTLVSSEGMAWRSLEGYMRHGDARIRASAFAARILPPVHPRAIIMER